MDKYILWVCVVGGSDEAERIIYAGNSMPDMIETAFAYSTELNYDIDKYLYIEGYSMTYTTPEAMSEYIYRHGVH